MSRRFICATAVALAIAAAPPGVRGQQAPPAPRPQGAIVEDAYPSTYARLPSRPTIIRNATILTAAGPAIARGSVLLQDGKIVAVGQTVAAPADAVVVDAGGRWVTPGIIDVHSHLGVYAAPGIESQQDGNEMTNPNTAEVSAEHSIWPQDPQFDLALAGGVTTMQILPGSGNLFGGRGVTIKNVPSRTMQGMKFPGAPYGLKMACGENPKRVYGSRNQSPATGHGQRGRLPEGLAGGHGISRFHPALAGRRQRSRRSGPPATSSSRRSPACSTAKSSCTTTAIAPTKWP